MAGSVSPPRAARSINRYKPNSGEVTSVGAPGNRKKLAFNTTQDEYSIFQFFITIHVVILGVT